MSQKIKIISDSTSDLTPALCEQYGISIVPLTVTLGTESFLDGVTISRTGCMRTTRSTKRCPKRLRPHRWIFKTNFRSGRRRGTT